MSTVVGDVYEVKVFTSQEAQLGINILHYRVDAIAAAGLTDLEVAQKLDPVYAPVYKACMTSDASYLGVTAQRISPDPVQPFTFSNANPGPGTFGGAPLPRQVAAVIKKLTGGVGRRKRGRMYIPFPDETANDVGAILTGPYKAALATLATTVLGPITLAGVAGTADLALGVWGRQLKIFSPVTGLQVRSVWGTQRRRGDFGATNLPFPL